MKEKHKMINYFTDYIIRFKYLKPRLFALLKQLDRLLKEKRKNIVLSAAILIQYHVKKWLKKLRAKRQPKVQQKKKKAFGRPPWRAPTKFIDNETRIRDKKIQDNLEKLNKKVNKKKKKKKH